MADIDPEIQKEMEEMDAGTPPEAEEPEAEAPVQEEPEQEASVEEAQEETQEESQEEPQEKPEAETEAEPQGAEQTEGEAPDKDELIATLRQQINSLASGPPTEPQPAGEDQPAQTPPAASGQTQEQTQAGQGMQNIETILNQPQPQAQAPMERMQEVEFVTSEQLMEIGNDPSELNKILNQVRLQAVKDTYQTVTQEVSQTIPMLVGRMVDDRVGMMQVANEFYAANEDLKPYKAVVGRVTNELSAQNPDLPLAQLLPLVEQESRKRLGLTKPAEISESQPAPPRTSSGGGASQPRKPKPTLSPMEAEMQEMDAAIRRNS